MKIFYPYNEILPTGRAHDVYVVSNCSSLAAAGLEVELTVGIGSLDEEAMLEHYPVSTLPEVAYLPILRRNNTFNLSWNFVFFGACQRLIARERPEVVITSVRKQGIYHFDRKIMGTNYVFELHELAKPQEVRAERKMLAAADLIVTTTPALAEILRRPPYDLTVPIEVVPLAVSSKPLPPTVLGEERIAAYVGQLYPKQGVELIIDALALTKGVRLEITGGNEKDIERIRRHALQVGVTDRVTFHGFKPPSELPALLRNVDLFVMPSKNIEGKPDIAHTKLLEYTNFGRPIAAPDSPVVAQHLGSLDHVISYELGSATSLAAAMEAPLPEARHDAPFSWEKRGRAYADLLKTLVSSS